MFVLTYPIKLEVYILVFTYIYIRASCIRAAKALANLPRLAWAFAAHPYDKNQIFVSQMVHLFLI